MLYLRLIYVPFSIMNFGMGLTKVRFWDYFFATGIGILAGTFILTFFIGAVREAWISGDWSGPVLLRVFLSLGLLVASLLLPKVIKRLKGEH